MLVDRSVLRQVVGVWGSVSSEVFAFAVVGDRFLCDEGPFNPVANGTKNLILASFGLFGSLRSCEWTVFICSSLSSLDGGDGDLVCFLCDDEDIRSEAYPLVYL